MNGNHHNNPYRQPLSGLGTNQQKEKAMNQEQAKGKFEQMKGKLKESWGRLTDDDVALYNGKREQFVGRLQEKYGLMKEEAENRLKQLEDSCNSNERAA